MAAEQGQLHSGADAGDDLVHLLSCQFESLGDAPATAGRILEEGDTLRFTFRWPLANWEALLARTGHRERLVSFRSQFLQAIAPSLAEVVEAMRGRETQPRSPEISADCQSASFDFALGAAVEDRAEERQAVRNWSSQLRRNARRQRTEHRRHSEEVSRVAEAMRETRRRLRESSALAAR